jgi:hypothetical protein
MLQNSSKHTTGKIGEYLVCVDLIEKGFLAFLSDEGCHYDVVLDTGIKIIKVQVKTTEKITIVYSGNKDSLAYKFQIGRAGHGGKKMYAKKEIDIFALVCLDTKKIGYVVNESISRTVNYRINDIKESYYDEKQENIYKEIIKLKEMYGNNITQIKIAKMLGVSVTKVQRYLKMKSAPKNKNAKYFDDIIRDKNWFYKL